MSTTIAGYYLGELTHWMRMIGFYTREISEFGFKLGEVIQSNTIPNLAEKVEAQQRRLDEVVARFKTLHTFIEEQHAELKTDHALVDNKLIKNDISDKQSQLRQQMQQAEKLYLDVKYECYQFLSETLKMQK